MPFVVMSGLPGSGKSTVAAPLAEALGLPLLAKDAIKETLWDTLIADCPSASPEEARSWSRRLGAASQQVLWRMAHDAGSGVIDTFVHREFRFEVLDLAGPLVEVHCACPVEFARSRYAARHRHPAHPDDAAPGGPFDRWTAHDAGPLRLGGTLIEVDTTRPVDVEAIAAGVRAAAPFPVHPPR